MLLPEYRKILVGTLQTCWIMLCQQSGVHRTSENLQSCGSFAASAAVAQQSIQGSWVVPYNLNCLLGQQEDLY